MVNIRVLFFSEGYFFFRPKKNFWEPKKKSTSEMCVQSEQGFVHFFSDICFFKGKTIVGSETETHAVMKGGLKKLIKHFFCYEPDLRAELQIHFF